MDKQIINKLNQFFGKYPGIKFKKNEILIKAGDEPKGIFYLINGNVRQYSIDNEGNEATLNIYKPHTFFPMSYAVGEYKNNNFFEAIEEVEVKKAPKNELLKFIKKEPEVMLDLLRRLYRGLEGVLSQLRILMSGTARQKLITVLLISAKRFGTSLKFTHQDLANMAGISRETVSREMNTLKKQNLVDYSGSFITFFDINNLEGELSSK